MGDRSGMSISADCPSDETLNRGPLALLLRRQYEFPFGINIGQSHTHTHTSCFTRSKTHTTHSPPGNLICVEVCDNEMREQERTKYCEKRIKEFRMDSLYIHEAK